MLTFIITAGKKNNNQILTKFILKFINDIHQMCALLIVRKLKKKKVNGVDYLFL